MTAPGCFNLGDRKEAESLNGCRDRSTDCFRAWNEKSDEKCMVSRDMSKSYEIFKVVKIRK